MTILFVTYLSSAVSRDVVSDEHSVFVFIYCCLRPSNSLKLKALCFLALMGPASDNCCTRSSGELKSTTYFTVFYVRMTVHRNKFLYKKPNRCTNFTNLFWHETLRVSDSSSVHHQEFIHCTLSNGICHTRL